MAQINKDYYEDLTPESLEDILASLKAGRTVTPGPQNCRQTSAPLGGPATLTDPGLYAEPEAREPAAPALTDAEPKMPGAAANVRERPVPKPPLAKDRKPRQK
jgi:NADH-quinone oxidoreductase subunit E